MPRGGEIVANHDGRECVGCLLAPPGQSHRALGGCVGSAWAESGVLSGSVSLLTVRSHWRTEGWDGGVGHDGVGVCVFE